MEILDQILGLWRIAKIAASLQSELPRFKDAEYVINVNRPEPAIQVVIQEGNEIGMPVIREEWLQLNNKVTVMSDGANQPIRGCWMIHHNFHEETSSFFYWTASLITVYYDQTPYRREINNASPQTS